MIGFGFENDLSIAKKLVPCCTKIVCMWKRKRKKTVKLVVGILLRMQWFKLSRRRVAPLHVMVAVTTTTLCDITMLAITPASAHCQNYISCLLQWLGFNAYLNINPRGLIGLDLTSRPTLSLFPVKRKYEARGGKCSININSSWQKLGFLEFFYKILGLFQTKFCILSRCMSILRGKLCISEFYAKFTHHLIFDIFLVSVGKTLSFQIILFEFLAKFSRVFTSRRLSSSTVVTSFTLFFSRGDCPPSTPSSL